MCSKTGKARVMSLNEKVEQEAIELSVHLDEKSKRVYIELPFVKDPVDYLSKKHKGSDNYNQALRIYYSQCRKNGITKDGTRATQKDLVENGGGPSLGGGGERRLFRYPR